MTLFTNTLTLHSYLNVRKIVDTFKNLDHGIQDFGYTEVYTNQENTKTSYISSALPYFWRILHYPTE